MMSLFRGGLVISCAFAAGALCLAESRRLADAATETQTPKLGRGVNILGYDGIWDGSVDNPFRMTDFRRIREAGFNHVRVNFFGMRYMDRDGRLDPRVLETLDKVLDGASQSNLIAVLDQHDNETCQSQPQGCKERLVSFWRQISERYAGKRPDLVYEILNEPGGHMSYDQWNEIVGATLAEIRHRDPGRVVVAPCLNTSDGAAIERLQIPVEDRRIIVTVHYYDPHRFTHQGASWSQELADVRNVGWGAAASRERVVRDLSVIARWVANNNRPVYLGEFGALETAPPISRAAWTRHVAKTAESFGWSWAYWQFDHDFSLTDPVTREWNRPLLDALMQ